MHDDAACLAREISELGSGTLLVVTGAGVSAASGLATFRGSDPGAIWSRDLLERATFAWFERDPRAWWEWFLDRFAGILAARPNPGHRALAALERWHTGEAAGAERSGDFLLVTQNIDRLHEAAGSRRLVKVHGTADRVRCIRHGCRHGAPRGSLGSEAFPAGATRLHATTGAAGPGDAPAALAETPACPECGSPLRPHGLLFDEIYAEHVDYGYERVVDAFTSLGPGDLVLFVGTSFAVGATEMALQAIRLAGTPAWSIDPGAQPPPGVRGIAAGAEQVLPEVCRRLGVEVPEEGHEVEASSESSPPRAPVSAETGKNREVPT